MSIAYLQKAARTPDVIDDTRSEQALHEQTHLCADHDVPPAHVNIQIRRLQKTSCQQMPQAFGVTKNRHALHNTAHTSFITTGCPLRRAALGTQSFGAHATFPRLGKLTALRLGANRNVQWDIQRGRTEALLPLLLEHTPASGRPSTCTTRGNGGAHRQQRTHTHTHTDAHARTHSTPTRTTGARTPTQSRT